jgi:hypothetical protein
MGRAPRGQPQPSPARRGVDLSMIKNKVRRSQAYLRQRDAKREEQRQDRRMRKRAREELGDAVRAALPLLRHRAGLTCVAGGGRAGQAPKPKQQKTLENTREYDETVVTADDEEVGAHPVHAHRVCYCVRVCVCVCVCLCVCAPMGAVSNGSCGRCNKTRRRTSLRLTSQARRPRS